MITNETNPFTQTTSVKREFTVTTNVQHNGGIYHDHHYIGDIGVQLLVHFIFYYSAICSCTHLRHCLQWYGTV